MSFRRKKNFDFFQKYDDSRLVPYLKQLVVSRWINSEILDRLVAIINLQSRETYALPLRPYSNR